MIPWRAALLKRLRGAAAPRVLDLAELMEEARAAKGVDTQGDAHERAVRRFTKEAETLGVLRPVRSGLWLNATAFPTPAPAEAAGRIRSGAVVSLQTVLGDAGILNNYSSQVSAVIPRREGGANPATGTIRAAGTLFHFKSIPETVLEAGEPADRLLYSAGYPRATAEAALVHWFYLAKSSRSPMRGPDTQCDVDFLDEDRLRRLASAAGVEDRAFEWMERCRIRQEQDDAQEGWGPGAR